MRRRLRAVIAAALLATLVLAGCGDEAGLSKDQQLSQKLLGDGFRVDVASAPTRADVGLTGDKTETDRHLLGNEPFEALVFFDTGETLQVTSDRMAATSASATAAPTELELGRGDIGYDELKQALDDLVRLFGVTPAEAAAVLREVRAAPLSDDDTTAQVTARRTGDATLDARIEVHADTDETTITWHVTWKPDSSKPSS